MNAGWASIVVGVVVLIGSVGAAQYVGTPHPGSSGGDAMAFGFCVIPLMSVLILTGIILALRGLAYPPRRVAWIGLALNVGSPILCTIFGSAVMKSLYPPPPKLQGSPFLEYCRSPEFGSGSSVVWSDLHNTSYNNTLRLRIHFSSKDDKVARIFVLAFLEKMRDVATKTGLQPTPIEEEKQDKGHPEGKLIFEYKWNEIFGVFSATFSGGQSSDVEEGERLKNYKMEISLDERKNRYRAHPSGK